MEAKATLNYTRISPRKVGIVLDLIRNKPVDLAAAILKHIPQSRLRGPGEAAEVRGGQCGEQLQYGPEQPVCFAVLCHPRPHSEADPSQRPRPGVPGVEENFSHHHCGEGKRSVSGKEAKIWVRK